MHRLEGQLRMDGVVAGRQAEDRSKLVGASQQALLEVELPAADVRQLLGVRELLLALSQLIYVILEFSWCASTCER